MKITCSKGTYIRTLAHDIAHALGTVGVVTRLHRIQDGPFKIEDSILLEDELKILPLDRVLGKLLQLNVSEEIAKRLHHGQRIKDGEIVKKIPPNTPFVVLFEKQVIAIARTEKDVIHPSCVFDF